MRTLRDIAAQAVEATRDDPEGNLLTASGKPTEFTAAEWRFRAREAPLTGEEAGQAKKAGRAALNSLLSQVRRTRHSTRKRPF
jgi:hypothetical protein